MSSFKALIIAGIMSCVWVAPASTAERLEALMLHGAACMNDADLIRQAVEKISGVNAVYATSVPGYLLIDVVVGMVTAEELTAAVNRVQGVEGTCRAEPMQSCISPGGHHPAEHGRSRTAAHE
jgi:copper chaperone CopZ